MSLVKNYVKSRECFKITFELPESANPEKGEIRLLGDFNNWNWEVAKSLKNVSGKYKVVLELPVGKKYEYRYLIDQSVWLNDGIADGYKPSPYEHVDNCVLDLDVPIPSKKLNGSIKVDDFTRIEGIGPKIAELIKNAGFTSYKELSESTSENIKSILTLAGKRYLIHDPGSWPAQAKLLAEGSLGELKKMQAKLKGGRKKR